MRAQDPIGELGLRRRPQQRGQVLGADARSRSPRPRRREAEVTTRSCASTAAAVVAREERPAFRRVPLDDPHDEARQIAATRTKEEERLPTGEGRPTALLIVRCTARGGGHAAPAGDGLPARAGEPEPKRLGRGLAAHACRARGRGRARVGPRPPTRSSARASSRRRREAGACLRRAPRLRRFPSGTVGRAGRGLAGSCRRGGERTRSGHGTGERVDVRPGDLRRVGVLLVRVHPAAPRDSAVDDASAPECLLSRPGQRRVHARDLAGGEHEHRGVVDVVHVVHEHVAVRAVAAGDVRERRLAEVRPPAAFGVSATQVGAAAAVACRPRCGAG